LILQVQDKQLQPQDGWIDEALRSLLQLPARNGGEPYADIFPIPAPLQINLEQLLAIATEADPARVEELLPHLLQTMMQYDITTSLRQSHFLAQLIHESGSFNYVEEIDSGEYLEGRTDLGNIEPGDGPRYKGRGLIQITGRDNYAACGHDLGVDLISEPTRLTENELACLSAGWFWTKNGLNALADEDDEEMVCRTINGGLNGFEERQYFLAIAKGVLSV
jgi:putative chitinase